MELAVMHGVARVQVKGHNEERNRELRSRLPSHAPRRNDGAWARKLAADFQQSARLGSVMVSGPSPDGPMSGPH